MFAYCGNNPVTRVDKCGENWEYIIKTIEIAIIDETKSQTTYRIKITYSGEYYNWQGSKTDSQDNLEATLFFTIDDEGAISFKNTQQDASHILIDKVRNRLAEVMYNICVSRVKNSLSKRTVEGISSELYWHYVLRSTGPGETANIGGRGNNVPGKDNNAWFFELFS